MDVERLYQEHAVKLLRYLARFSGDPELAADAVQETFLKLVETPPRSEDGLRTWLYRVGTNLVMEKARSRRRQLQLLTEFPERVPLGDTPADPATELERRERAQLVRTAMANLSARDRTVLLMRAEGFAYREIAEAVATTTQSVGTIIARALRKLAVEIQRNGRPAL